MGMLWEGNSGVIHVYAAKYFVDSRLEEEQSK
jgi:hypothetical protein